MSLSLFLHSVHYDDDACNKWFIIISNIVSYLKDEVKSIDLRQNIFFLKDLVFKIL